VTADLQGARALRQHYICCAGTFTGTFTSLLIHLTRKTLTSYKPYAMREGDLAHPQTDVTGFLFIELGNVHVYAPCARMLHCGIAAPP